MTTQPESESVRVISVSPDAEKTMGYCARVSNPANQDNPDVAKLLAYCINKGHWSVFEHAFLTLEIKTSRGIAPQILRHRSFCFQEFSQRYAEVPAGAVVIYEARRKAEKNRQSSVDDLPEEDRAWFRQAQAEVYQYAHATYEEALRRGIATECARFLLPLNTRTTLYMSGSVRSWIHYLDQRTKSDVQLEHQRIALKARTIFCEQFPIVAAAKGWLDPAVPA